jgi:hypothetical protein
MHDVPSGSALTGRDEGSDWQGRADVAVLFSEPNEVCCLWARIIQLSNALLL